MTFLIGTIATEEMGLPLMVFVAETCVLTLATLRTICISRGKKVPSALLGFFEVSIWLFAVGQVMQNLTNLGCATGFAAGFSLGNYLGILIEQRLAIGNVSVQVTTSKEASTLMIDLRLAGFGVTKIDGQGSNGPVEVIVTVVQRKKLPEVSALIRRFDSTAFYSVHDLQTAAEGVFPKRHPSNTIPAPLRRMLRVAVKRRRVEPVSPV